MTLKATSGTARKKAPTVPHDPTYEEFLKSLQEHFTAECKRGPLLAVRTSGFWPYYLASIPLRARQTHLCRTCESFVQRWGGAVTVDARGNVRSALWSIAEELVPFELRRAVRKLELEVLGRTVIGALVSSDEVLGVPNIGGFEHLAVKMPAAMVHKSSVLTAGQRAAELAENAKHLTAAASAWTNKTHLTAIDLLELGNFDRDKKFLPHAKWLAEVKEMRRHLREPYRTNRTWKAVVEAPAGWCTPRSQVLGALLDDIDAGKPLPVIKKAFEEKVDPLAYMRPTAAPKAGTVDRAEVLFEKMGLARSLERRMAMAHELTLTWRPVQPTCKPGLFAELRKATPTDKRATLSRQTMSWRVFAEDYLEKGAVETLSVLAPAHSSAFVAYTTAVHADAPPILRWDCEDQKKRNPVAWYFRARGVAAAEWGLQAGALVPCLGVVKRPSCVGNDHGHGFEDIPVLLLQGAQDLRQSGLALFPEMLRNELHEVRSVIEAYASRTALSKAQVVGTVAAGIEVPTASRNQPLTLRVALRNGLQIDVIIDRLR